ncbi:hypothetical protein AMTRI_Chr08g204040 [Amborella trichopoda]
MQNGNMGFEAKGEEVGESDRNGPWEKFLFICWQGTILLFNLRSGQRSEVEHQKVWAFTQAASLQTLTAYLNTSHPLMC